MRRIRFLFVLALAAVGLAAPVTPAAARTPFSVLISCWNNGGGTFACRADPHGGTGSYVSHNWTITYHEPDWWIPPYTTYPTTGSSDTFYSTCEVGGSFSAQVTLIDSSGAVATSNQVVRHHCSQWAE